MIIFKDLLSGDELFSDAFKLQLVGQNKHFYAIRGKRVTETNSDANINIGSNPSAEEAPEALSEHSVTEIDVVLAHRLMQMADMNLKEYGADCKTYMKKLLAKKDEIIKGLEDEGRTKEAEEMKEEKKNFIATFPNDMKEVITTGFKKKQYLFYKGESGGDEGMFIPMTYPEDDEEGRPVLYFIRYGLEEVKF